jgi:hypothetical protein
MTSVPPPSSQVPEVMVEALEDAYLNTTDRFDARNEFRVALRAALDAAPPGFFVRAELADQLAAAITEALESAQVASAPHASEVLRSALASYHQGETP